MELIFEVLVRMVWWLVEVFAELLIQIFGEALADLFSFKVAERRASRASRIMAPPPEHPTFWQALGKCMLYTLIGAVLGWLSTLVFPRLFIRSPVLELLHILISPVLAALAMVWLGKWRQQRSPVTVGFDRFMYAYCFALSMAVLRNAYAL